MRLFREQGRPVFHRLIWKIPALAFDKIRRIDLKRKVLLIISSAVLVISLFCYFVFSSASLARIRREKELNLQNYFFQSKAQLETYLNRIDFVAYTVIFSSWVQQLIRNRPVSLVEQLLYRTNVQSFLQSLIGIYDDIYMVLITDRETIVTNSMPRYNPLYRIEEEPWFPELLQNKKYTEYNDGRLFVDLDREWSLTRYYIITDINNFNTIGYLAVNIPAEKFSFLLSNSQYDWIEVTASDGSVLIDEASAPRETAEKPDDPKTRLSRPGARGWIVYEDTLMDGHWNARLFQRLQVIAADEIRNYYLFFILLIPILGIFIIITLAFSRYLTNPIVNCRNAMLEIQNNNFGISLENRYHDEIGGLITGFNEMSSTLVTLRQENAEIEKLRREAEIGILQQKVNPHFLYNTLEIINGLILDGQYGEAVQVCELLGQIYHYNLMNNKWVRLRDECEYVRQYLGILQHKKNNLSVVWETDEHALGTGILKLILQPLVENAVLHGLRSRLSDACLTIAVTFRSDKVELLIMDNGSGFRSGVLPEIEETLSAIRRGISPDSTHIGIPNVYQRLYLEYGEAMEFSIESRPNYGTKIMILLPVKTNIETGA